ncbi:acetate--CoA ligase family protein [Saccharopolyspora erythraea]|uniref:acetate--CoA ligase family protein n=1 Tax=Saccharopolyspora erythraea TaxID=1836 RepID=UPI001BAD8E3B|nr:acetate--CoA ligase family protein [Saccharopolyspora erythraea]QUH04155.1 acetate--CoA ligase family protein [Saccharopolyspora erythraea]
MELITQVAAPSRSSGLQALFAPRSVAIVGASDDPEKYGNWLAVRAVSGPRPAFLINARRSEAIGQPTFRSLSDVNEDVDLAVLAVPAAAFESVVDDALAAGVRAIVGITAGLGESGASGRRLQESIANRVREAGAVMLGPNCLGVLDTTTGLDATVNSFVPGSIALLTQSGNVAIDVGQQLAQHGLGISRFASLGNQADLDAADLINACVEHDQTKAIALYTEGIKDGRRFTEALARAENAGKPVVLLAAGRSQASARGAASHTGSMVSSQTVIQAACDATGAELVASPYELANLMQALVKTNLPTGRRIAVFADGGGHASLASDALEQAGLSVDPFNDETQHRIGELLPNSSGTANPIDTAGAGEKDPRVFVRVVEELGQASDVDATLLTGYLGGYGEYSVELATKEVEAARELATAVNRDQRCLIAQLMFDRSSVSDALRDGGIAVYRHVEDAAWVLRRLTIRHERKLAGLPRQVASQAPLDRGDYWNARETLSAAGIPFVRAHRVETEAELIHHARQMNYPLVLKALGDDHKSDRGGVMLNLRSEEQLITAWADLQARLAPPAVSLEEMADLSTAVELIVGVRRDPAFGPLVLVGIGGVFTELLHDTTSALGPVNAEQALDMFSGLRGARLLNGYRGKPSVNLASAATLVAQLSEFAAAHPEISEIECNPVAVTPDRAIALDARISLGQHS